MNKSNILPKELIEQIQKYVDGNGGAWAAINAALGRPDLIYAVIADSFDGWTLNDNFSDNLLSERTRAKNDVQARQFYEWCQGKDWEKIVDLDTEALLQCAREKRPLFHKSLKDLRVPVLLVGSKEDEMCRSDLEDEYKQMSTVIPDAKAHIFNQGGHPAILYSLTKISVPTYMYKDRKSTRLNSSHMA